MTSGLVSFVGAGPGAADLITLRGAKRIAEADIVVWAASLVDPACVSEHARKDAELIDSSRITHDEVIEIYRRAASLRLRVARVHSGDPSLWGAVQEQYDSAQRLGLDVEIVPGVSAFSAAAAIVGRELTVPEVAQSVILTRLEGGKTPMPDGEHIREFARHGTTMAIFLSAARSGQLVDELREGGYADDTPVVIAYKATWPDELILHTTIGELSDTVKQHKLWRHTLFLVGKALRAGGTRSHLYNAGHFHTFRKADPAARRALRAERAAGTELTESTTGGADPDAGVKAKAGWPLHASRSGWVAARVNAWPGEPQWRSTGLRPVTGESRTGRSDDRADGQRPVADQATEVSPSASVAAWSAVHEWQETARSAGRGGSRSRAADHQRPARAVASDQGTFALDGEQAAASTGSVAETGGDQAAAPKTGEPADVVPAQELPAGSPVAGGQDRPDEAPKEAGPAADGGTQEAGTRGRSGQAKPRSAKAPAKRAPAKRSAKKPAGTRSTGRGPRSSGGGESPAPE